MSSSPKKVWDLDLKPGRYPIREAANLDRPAGPALFLEDGRAFWLKVRPQLLQQVRMAYTERHGILFRSPGQDFDLEVREFDPQSHRLVGGLSPRGMPGHFRKAFNMASLDITPKGAPGYPVLEVRKVALQDGNGKRSFNVLVIEKDGGPVEVISRAAIDAQLNAGFNVERIQASGKRVELRIFAKNPLPGREGRFEVEATLKKIPAADALPTATLENVFAVEPAQPGEAAATGSEPPTPTAPKGWVESACAEGSPPPATQAPASEELDNEDPVRRPDGNFRWKGALFSTREEMLLAKALMDQGAMGVASNSSLLLQRSSKLHRKPDLLVFHNVEDRLVFGIAEVDGSSHEGRWANDQERHRELQAAGFLCIRHYTAEEVFLDPVRAARDFLSFLEKFHPTGQRSSLLRM